MVDRGVCCALTSEHRWWIKFSFGVLFATCNLCALRIWFKCFLQLLVSSACSSCLICAAPVKPSTWTPFSHTWTECRHSVRCWTKRYRSPFYRNIAHKHCSKMVMSTVIPSYVSQVKDSAEGMGGPNMLMSLLQRLITDPDNRQHFYQVSGEWCVGLNEISNWNVKPYPLVLKTILHRIDTTQSTVPISGCVPPALRAHIFPSGRVACSEVSCGTREVTSGAWSSTGNV